MFKVRGFRRGFKGLLPRRPVAGVSMLIAAALVLWCPAHDSYGRGRASQQPQRPADESAGDKQGSKVVVPDVTVLNQDGKPINFYTDLVKGKTVVVDFIYSTCQYVCPLQGESMANLQAMLGDRLGTEVVLISVSLDPETDTPERLKAWGKMFGAKEGWTLLTGKKQDIDRIIKAFTGGSTGRGEHSPLWAIGNEGTGIWVHAYGLTAPNNLMRLIDKVGGPASNPK